MSVASSLRTYEGLVSIAPSMGLLFICISAASVLPGAFHNLVFKKRIHLRRTTWDFQMNKRDERIEKKQLAVNTGNK